MLRGETAGSHERRAAALTGLRAYQAAARPALAPPAPALQCEGRATLRDYGGPVDTTPIVLVPSLINPPFILDLAPGNSLIGHLRDEGFRPLLLDWGTPTPADRELDIAAHVERILLPLIARLDRPPMLVGYCLGGTMALAAACVADVAGLALIAAPWRFSGYGERARADIAALWQAAKPGCEALGLVPMEVLQTGFWHLDPAKTIAKYEGFGRLDPASDTARAFVRLEDWANAGAPLSYAAGRQLFEDFVGRDITGDGGWRVGTATVDPASLACPAIEFAARHDRIVPAASAADLPHRHDLGAGHVGMMVGRAARAQLWGPLTAWLGALRQPR